MNLLGRGKCCSCVLCGLPVYPGKLAGHRRTKRCRNGRKSHAVHVRATALLNKEQKKKERVAERANRLAAEGYAAVRGAHSEVWRILGATIVRYDNRAAVWLPGHLVSAWNVFQQEVLGSLSRDHSMIAKLRRRGVLRKLGAKRIKNDPQWREALCAAQLLGPDGAMVFCEETLWGAVR